MKPFTTVTGYCAVLSQDNIDTDQLIPARFMNRTRAVGYGAFLFHDLRQDSSCGPRLGFDIDLTEPEQAILVAGSNFGCGSSREAAVYALMDCGFRVVIARSFADIFRNNAGKNGLLTLTLAEPNHSIFLANLGIARSQSITVDLEQQSLSFGAAKHLSFAIDSTLKRRLLLGLDDLTETLQSDHEISAFEKAHRAKHPWIMPGDG